jgi:glycosyltransferase involved in cell wall biosynthesis
MARFLVDFSLALINRTGAFHVGRDLLAGAQDQIGHVRYWRMYGKNPPSGLFGKLLGRAMCRELELGRQDGVATWPRKRDGASMLYLDPLYVLRSELRSTDLVLCHDVGPISHPDLFLPQTTELYRKAYAKIAEVKPRMAFVSHASAQEFATLYGAKFPLMEVIPLGLRPAFQSNEMAQPAGIAEPFLLMVGGLERRKNHIRVFKAFQKTGLAQKGVSLVVVGPRGLDAQKIKEAAEATPGVVMLGYVNDLELRWLFARARGFVLPSLLEGFGVPALEAAAHGLPSLLSQGGALEEAVNSAGIFCDPQSIDSIAAGMEELLDLDEARRSEIVEHAREQARHLTVERFRSQWRRLLDDELKRRS